MECACLAGNFGGTTYFSSHTLSALIKAEGSYMVEQDPCMLDSRNRCYREQNSSFPTSSFKTKHNKGNLKHGKAFGGILQEILYLG